MKLYILLFSFSYLFLSDGNIKTKSCTDFRYGCFTSIAKNYQDFKPIIQREKNDTQIEIFTYQNKKYKAFYNVKWHDSCHYTLYFVSSNNDILNKIYEECDSTDIYFGEVLNKKEICIQLIFKRSTSYDTLRKIDCN